MRVDKKNVRDMCDFCIGTGCEHEKCPYYMYCIAFRKKYHKTPSRSRIGGYWNCGDYAYEHNENLTDLVVSVLNKEE